MSFLANTVYWAVLISLTTYFFGDFLKKKTKLIIFNPLLFSTVMTVIFLLLFNIEYDSYYEKADILYFLLTPTTVCLAIPLYEQVNLLKKNILAIVLGILSGVIACLTTILFFAVFFNWSHTMYVTILPKSITAAMAMGVSQELGGIASLTVPIVIMTGIFGNIIAEYVCNTFRINEPISRGLAIGSASHAMGTVKAMEMGSIEGAMSSLSMAVAGVLTVICASIFSYLH